ncbi:MAG: putative toxin-antitoxin system toxin component, PIN family [Dehalococcoidia bacterium]
MRIVLDTNVVVSAAFFGGPPRRVIDAWIAGRVQFVLTPLIFDEYLRVCQRLSATYADTDYQPLLTAFLAQGILVADPAKEEAITQDADDDKFMRCARAADAIVVSGDRHLLDADGWHGVPVRTPAQILADLPD